MFGISAWEFLLLIVIAILIIPSRDLPSVFRFVAKVFQKLRDLFWNMRSKIDDFTDEVSKFDPSGGLNQQTMDDMIATFASPLNEKKSKPKIKSKSPAKSPLLPAKSSSRRTADKNKRQK